MAILPWGINTKVSRPACALYAAADAEVFPVEAHITVLEPVSIALEIARVIPRSLNEPDGLVPSNLRYSSTEGAMAWASLSARIKGVFPSRRVTTGV